MKQMSAVAHMKKDSSPILLQETGIVLIENFLKEKTDGGLFDCIDPEIFKAVYPAKLVKNSPAVELAGYTIRKRISRSILFNYAKAAGMYIETDFAHIKQICERHMNSEELLLVETGSANFFLIRNIYGRTVQLSVSKSTTGWCLYGDICNEDDFFRAGQRIFFRNIRVIS